MAANTFVGGSALRDKHGHGTFVAGLIAARLDNEGIAGLAFPAGCWSPRSFVTTESSRSKPRLGRSAGRSTAGRG